MSKFSRLFVGAACVAALLFAMSSAAQAAPADGDSPAKVSKKSKSGKSANKKSANKPADAGKTKSAAKYDNFEDESSDSGSAAKSKSKSSEKAAASKSAEKTRNVVVRFSLHGEYPEGATSDSPFSDMQPTLSKLMDRLNEAKADKDVKAIWLRIEDLELGRGKLSEVRAAIAAVRKAGKPVYAELITADTGGYLVASACDWIYMPSSGEIAMPGVRLEVTFYKGLLDKLGLKFDMLHMGKFKGAAEPMTRTTMSAPLRESLQSIVDDVYDHMVHTIAKDRHLPGLHGQDADRPGLVQRRRTPRTPA